VSRLMSKDSVKTDYGSRNTAKKPYILWVFNACLVWDFMG
jgi:hypothetical protein